MKKYRVRFAPIVFDVYAECENDALDVAWHHADEIVWDDGYFESIEEYDGDLDAFYPVNLGDVFGTCQHDWQYDDSGDGTMVCHLGCGSVKEDKQ